MSASDSKVVVDHESDLLSSLNPVLFLGFLLLEADLLLKWELWMILFKAEAILASSISRFGKSLPAIDRKDFHSSTESAISTSLIHDVASEENHNKNLLGS